MRFLINLLCLLLASAVLAQDTAVVDFIAEHPEDVAIMCQQGDSHVSHNAEERFPLASAFKLFVLAEFGRQFDAGLIDPDETMALDDVNAYWLPGSDAMAHDQFLAYLGSDRQQVTLRELAMGMIRFSSNAATDSLMERLGYEGYPTLYDMLEIENSDRPTRLMIGDFLVIDNHETGSADLAALDSEMVNAESTRLADLYVSDADWHAAELHYRQEQLKRYEQAMSEEDTTLLKMVYEAQGAFGTRFGFMGTASDVLRVMQAVYEGNLFSHEAQSFMQDTLNWLFDVNPANRDVYKALGNKGGSWAGIFTGVWYVQPDGGTPTLLAVLYRNLPDDLWAEWAVSWAQQQIEVRVFANGEGCDVFAVATQDAP